MNKKTGSSRGGLYMQLHCYVDCALSAMAHQEICSRPDWVPVNGEGAVGGIKPLLFCQPLITYLSFSSLGWHRPPWSQLR